MCNKIKTSSRLWSVIFLTMSFSFFVSQEVYSQKKNKKESQQEQVSQQKIKEDVGTKGKEDYGNTVSLVTFGTGKTKEEATNNALRSAIEQAFGTFVSSNTKILNDEMIKDEIVSISSGNILGYDVISSDETDNGYNVSIKSVVSIGKLVSYTESHGGATELAGNTFIKNRNLAKLNIINEQGAILNMFNQLSQISSKGLFDFSLDVSEPRGTGDWIEVGIRVKATPNENMKVFWELVDHTLSNLSMTYIERKNFEKLGFETRLYDLAQDKQLNESCDIYNIIKEIINQNDHISIPYKSICLRNYYDFYFFLKSMIISSRFSFEIYDNLGTLIRPSLTLWDKKDDNEFPIEAKKHDVNFAFYQGRLKDAYFFDFLNNKKDPYLKRNWYYDDNKEAMKNMSLKLYYSANSLSQLKNISIRPLR